MNEPMPDPAFAPDPASADRETAAVVTRLAPFFRRLLHVLEQPYDEQPGHEDLAALPPDWAEGLQMSCSS